MGRWPWVMADGRDLGDGAASSMWARTLEPLMTDRECNWPGGNNMPGACQVRQVLPARFLQAGTRDTALATARLIASSHSNIIAVSHYRSDHNHTARPSLESFGLQPGLYRPWIGDGRNGSMRHFFCLFLARPRRQLLTRWRPETSGPWMGNFTPVQRPGGPADLVAMRSVRLARGLRPPAALGRAEQRAQKSPHPPARSLIFHPQETPFPPPTPNDVSLERPRNASCWIGSEYRGIFPRSFSGHCPSSCAPLPPAYSYIRAYRRSVSGPGQPEIETILTPTLGKRFHCIQVK